jgi:hypothetical protein
VGGSSAASLPLNFSDEQALIVYPDLMAMDERRTLSILGWTIGGVVATVFVLNAIALALT